MVNNRNLTSVKAAVSAGMCKHPQAPRSPIGRTRPVASLPLQSYGAAGFTLAELLITIGGLVVLVLLATQLLNTATTVTTLGHKQMDAESQARQLLDRMAIDVAQMVKRSDVDYYLKSSATRAGVRNLLQPGNDKIAFYSLVPGYQVSGSTRTQQSPVSLVSYKVNAQHKLERMGKGLVWSSVSTADTYTPVVFMPIPLASPLPLAELPNPTPNPISTPAWPTVADFTASPSPEPNADVVGPQVFRFEYYYLLKGQIDPITPGVTYAPILSDIPWESRLRSCPEPTPNPTPTLCCHTAPAGMQDVAAVVVDIAVIDSQSRVLVTNAQLARLNGADGQPPLLVDFASGMTSGQLLAQWRAALEANATGLPRPTISGIRVYERYLYLSPPTLLTP